MKIGSVLFIVICITCIGSAHAGLVLTADSVLTLIPFEAQFITAPPLLFWGSLDHEWDWALQIEPIQSIGALTFVPPENAFPFYEEPFDLETLLGYNQPLTPIYPDGSFFFYIPEPSTVLLLTSGLIVQLKR